MFVEAGTHVDEDTRREREGDGRTGISAGRFCQNRLDHGHDGGHTPLYIGELRLDGLLLAQDGLQLLVGLPGFELADLLFILLRPETVPLTDRTLGLAVYQAVSTT